MHTEGMGSLWKTCFKWDNNKMHLKIMGVIVGTKFIWLRIKFGRALALMKLPVSTDQIID
jgi:hypothetical protein